MNDLVSDSLDKLLWACSTPEVVRRIEQGGSADKLWAGIEQSGFLDALVAESAGGAGLTLSEILPIFLAEGRYCLPVPLGHTMVARAALAREGHGAPEGAIAIATQVCCDTDGAIRCQAVPYGRVVQWVVAAVPHAWLVLPVSAADVRTTGIHASLRTHMLWTSRPPQTVVVGKALAWQHIGAVITAAQLAGAMERTLALTTSYANERTQFGRSIGKFQAVQHQLSVMAEQVFAARMAAELGCAGSSSFIPNRMRAAMAKARASEAVGITTSVAHAVHGAMGVTAECDLHLFTRRMHEWRADYGSEGHWNRQLGEALLSSDASSALDFMLRELTPPVAVEDAPAASARTVHHP